LFTILVGIKLNELIEEGLQLLGAEKHLALFQEQCKKVSLMSTVKRDKFFKSKLEGVNPVRDVMNSDTFMRLKKI
jgi:hypothetical protein